MSDPVCTDQQLCPHGYDKRFVRCNRCEDPAFDGTAVFRPAATLHTVSFSGVPLNSGQSEVIRVLRDEIAKRDDRISYLTSLVQKLIGPTHPMPPFGDSIRDASNEFRSEGADHGATATGGAGEVRAQPSEASRDGEAESGAATEDASRPHSKDRSPEETAGEVAGDSASVLEGGKR